MQRGFFKRDAVRRLFAEHRAKYRDHYDRIWRLLNLELWHRVCLEGEPHDFASRRTTQSTLVSTV
jgi:hypothetical protein